jgi:hypothetical protein
MSFAGGGSTPGTDSRCFEVPGRESSRNPWKAWLDSAGELQDAPGGRYCSVIFTPTGDSTSSIAFVKAAGAQVAPPFADVTDV